jgi:hypothetical protein
MPLFGTLKTMALPDLLQWLATARMTGTLKVERNKVSKSIILDNGEVVGCSSDDPPELLGQFLLARGKISEEQLRQALKTQEQERKHLGLILVEMNVLSPDELTAHLEAKAEETIYSLFDWEDAAFRFQQGESEQPNVLPISLRVEDVLLRGLRRYDETQRIREVLHDPGIVLRRTNKVPPREVFENRMARTLYEAIDGERTIEEILLHVHGSEFIVTKFLFELQRNGFAEIIGIKRARQADDPAEPEPVEVPVTPVADLADTDAPASIPPAPEATPALGASLTPETCATTDPAIRPAVAVAEQPDEAPTEPGVVAEKPKAERRLEAARDLMRAGQYETALDLLDELYRASPQDESLRRLTAEAEAAFMDKAYRHYLPAAKVPVLVRPVDTLESESFSPTEFFLLSRIDGSWDVKSIVQIAPLREVECLRTLKRLRESGIFELRDPE